MELPVTPVLPNVTEEQSLKFVPVTCMVTPEGPAVGEMDDIETRLRFWFKYMFEDEVFTPTRDFIPDVGVL